MPGARFRGRNVAGRLLRWTRTCEVLTAEPGREFAFRTVPSWRYPDSTVWRYLLEPSGTGTQITESYRVVKLPPRPVLAVYRRLLPHHMDMRPHIRRTLEAMARQAEAVAVPVADDAPRADDATADDARWLPRRRAPDRRVGRLLRRRGDRRAAGVHRTGPPPPSRAAARAPAGLAPRPALVGTGTGPLRRRGGRGCGCRRHAGEPRPARCVGRGPRGRRGRVGARSVLQRATRVDDFALGRLPAGPFAAYVRLTLAGLALLGAGFLVGGQARRLGGTVLVATAVFLAAQVRFRDIPPFVFYLLFLVVGVGAPEW